MRSSVGVLVSVMLGEEKQACFPEKSAVLAEISAVLVEKSAVLVDFALKPWHISEGFVPGSAGFLWWLPSIAQSGRHSNGKRNLVMEDLV